MANDAPYVFAVGILGIKAKNNPLVIKFSGRKLLSLVSILFIIDFLYMS